MLFIRTCAGHPDGDPRDRRRPAGRVDCRCRHRRVPRLHRHRRRRLQAARQGRPITGTRRDSSWCWKSRANRSRSTANWAGPSAKLKIDNVVVHVRPVRANELRHQRPPPPSGRDRRASRPRRSIRIRDLELGMAFNGPSIRPTFFPYVLTDAAGQVSYRQGRSRPPPVPRQARQDDDQHRRRESASAADRRLLGRPVRPEDEPGRVRPRVPGRPAPRAAVRVPRAGTRRGRLPSTPSDW